MRHGGQGVGQAWLLKRFVLGLLPVSDGRQKGAYRVNRQKHADKSPGRNRARDLPSQNPHSEGHTSEIAQMQSRRVLSLRLHLRLEDPLGQRVELPVLVHPLRKELLAHLVRLGVRECGCERCVCTQSRENILAVDTGRNAAVLVQTRSCDVRITFRTTSMQATRTMWRRFTVCSPDSYTQRAHAPTHRSMPYLQEVLGELEGHLPVREHLGQLPLVQHAIPAYIKQRKQDWSPSRRGRGKRIEASE